MKRIKKSLRYGWNDFLNHEPNENELVLILDPETERCNKVAFFANGKFWLVQADSVQEIEQRVRWWIGLDDVPSYAEIKTLRTRNINLNKKYKALKKKTLKKKLVESID